MALPTVTGVTPGAISPNGGDTVTITGTNFNNGNLTAVTFGGVAAESFTIINGTTATAVAPPQAGVSKTVDVRVTNSSGSSVTSSADQVTYGNNWADADYPLPSFMTTQTVPEEATGASVSIF